jgi:hypothetical protein
MSVRFAQSRSARPALRASAQLWLLYALFFVAGVAQAAIVPLLPRLSGHFDLSASQTALLLALPGLATLAVSVPSGLAADRIGARRVTIGAGALLCLSCLAQAAPWLPALLLGRIVFGVAFGVVWTTGMAWLADLDHSAGRSGLGPAVTCSSVGIMVGPAVGGILAQHAGLGAPFAAIAVATVIILVPLFCGTTAAQAAPAGPEAASCGSAAAQAAPVGPDAASCGSAAAQAAPVGPDAASCGSAAAQAAPVGPDAAPCGTTAAQAAPVGPVAVVAPRRLEPADLPLDIAYSQPPIADQSALTPSTLLAMARRPRVTAAAGALVVSGAVSSVSQLLISGGLHHLGFSSGRIGLAFSAAAVCYIVVSATVVRLGARAQTLRFNALTTAALAFALLPALAGDGVVALVAALMLTAGPRAVISTIAYSLAAGEGEGEGEGEGSPDGGADGVVFGMLNGAWAAATVLMPIVAGALEQAAGAQAAYLAVIIPSCAIAACLMAGAGDARLVVRRAPG